MNKTFADFMQKYKGRDVAVAVSGGADSMALLHMAAEWAGKGNITALTVDHGLRKESAAEAKMVAAAAKKLGVPYATLKWTGDKPETGVEEAARRARYGLMLDWCRDNGAGVLLLAHHADDQIETFLMNLGRGSGIYGLAAMRPEQTRGGIVIARPMLNMTRAEIDEYVRKRKIKFISDPMNEDEKFLRVKIRKSRRLMRDRLDISDAQMLTAIKALGRVRDVVEDDVDKLVSCAIAPGDPRAVFGASFLYEMPEELRLKFLSRVFQITGKLDYPPRLEKVRRADYMLKSDCKFTTSRCIVRRLGTKILIAPEGASSSFRIKK